MIEVTALDPSRQHWFETACSLIDERRLGLLIRRLTEFHSPTGAERSICEFLASYLSAAGLESQYQSVGADSGNCIAWLRGSGGGPSVLACEPVDTHLDADPGLDVPWVGPELRADMLPRALVQGESVVGLGSSNPKSMVASVIEAVQCLISAKIPLTGDVVVAFCGGGMP